MMTKMIIAIAVASLRLPVADNFRNLDWNPEFTEPAEIQIVDSTLAILTHCSQRFDPLRQSQPAVERVVSQIKAASLPVLYLHDRYNPMNPGWVYLYSDWNPTAYVASDVGHIEINLSQVEHVVCLGGFFEQCEQSTVTDVVRLWHRDGFCHDLRITQVVDGVFAVGAQLKFEDPYSRKVRDFYNNELRRRHTKAAMTVDQMILRIDDQELVPEFLQRQLPYVRPDFNVVLDVFGDLHTLQIVNADAPTLTFAYRRSNDFLNFQEPELDFTEPARRWLSPNRLRRSSF